MLQDNCSRRIQKSYKSHLFRSNLQKCINIRKKNSATKIQKVFRGYLCRDGKYRLKALKIQKMYRGYLGRKKFKIKRMEMESMKALLIQRIYRGYNGRKLAKRVRNNQKNLPKLYRNTLINHISFNFISKVNLIDFTRRILAGTI